MNSTTFQIDQDGDVAILKMARPPANAITFEMAKDFEAAFDDIVEGGPRALVLSGSGNFFSGGLDLREVPTYSAARQRDFLEVVDRLIAKLYASPFPVVAAANGHAVAAGYILLLTADYRFGPSGAFHFGLTEARVGIPFPAAPMTILKAELAPSDVRYTVLYAKNYGPDEALRRGVFDELCQPADVLDRAIEVANDLASMPGDAYARIKYQVRGVTIEALNELNRSGADPMMENWIDPSARDASAAVLEGS